MCNTAGQSCRGQASNQVAVPHSGVPVAVWHIASCQIRQACGPAGQKQEHYLAGAWNVSCGGQGNIGSGNKKHNGRGIDGYPHLNTCCSYLALRGSTSKQDRIRRTTKKYFVSNCFTWSLLEWHIFVGQCVGRQQVQANLAIEMVTLNAAIQGVINMADQSNKMMPHEHWTDCEAAGAR